MALRLAGHLHPGTAAGRRRAGMMLGVLLLCLALLAVRLVYVQGVRSGQYRDEARKIRLRTLVLPGGRGAIYDRGGRELAMSVPARTIYANPYQVRDKAGTARTLAGILGADESDLRAKLSQKRGFVYLARRVDVAVAGRIESQRLPGVGALDEPRRGYPGGALASNVIGFVGTDATGLAGIEAAYDKLLAGKAGEWMIEQDPSGRPIPNGLSRVTPAVAGSDLVLTLDRDIQFAADQALAKAVQNTNAKGGTVVVMRPGSGELLAIANQPTYDPNDTSNLKDLEQVRNRAVSDAYEPGSANKVITAAAALEERVVAPTQVFSVASTINVAGKLFHDSHSHPTESMTFSDIIAQSSNVGTIKVALQVGPQRLQTYLSRFGYGRTTGLGLPSEQAGILPSTTRWKTSLPTMAIGQGVSVTAIQIMRVFATVANDGVMTQPKLVAGWVDAAGKMHPSPASRTQRVISSATAAQLRAMLARVVSEGTGTLAAIPGYTVGGKTGTAQKPAQRGGYGGDYMASFIGMVPAGNPELVIGVVLDDPTPIYGGAVSAPVFSEVGRAALRILRVPPANAGGPQIATNVTPSGGGVTPASNASKETAAAGARMSGR